MLFTGLFKWYVRAAGVAGLRLAFVHVAFQVADHVRLTGDGDRAHHTVVVSHVSS